VKGENPRGKPLVNKNPPKAPGFKKIGDGGLIFALMKNGSF